MSYHIGTAKMAVKGGGILEGYDCTSILRISPRISLIVQNPLSIDEHIICMDPSNIWSFLVL